MDTFTYLGSLTTWEAESTKDLKAKLSKAHRLMQSLKNLWSTEKSQCWYRNKNKAFEVINLDSGIYGCEGEWRSNKCIKTQALRLRQLICISWTERKSNDWLYYRKTILNFIYWEFKKRKFSYSGHTMRTKLFDICVPSRWQNFSMVNPVWGARLWNGAIVSPVNTSLTKNSALK